jgi:Tfp pilus assembly protein PilN
MTITQTTTRPGFTQVNLLPPENRERQQAKRKTQLIGLVGAVVIGALVFLSFSQNARVADVQSKVSAQNAVNAQLQTEVSSLQEYSVLRQSLSDRQTLEQTAMAGDLSWSNVLHQVATVLPENVWLTSMSGTTTAAQAEAGATTPGATGPSSSVVGSLTFQCDSLDTDSLVKWLRALRSVHGWANPWVSSAQKTAVGNTNVWQCASSVDLTHAALSPIGGRG